MSWKSISYISSNQDERDDRNIGLKKTKKKQAEICQLILNRTAWLALRGATLRVSRRNKHSCFSLLCFVATLDVKLRFCLAALDFSGLSVGLDRFRGAESSQEGLDHCVLHGGGGGAGTFPSPVGHGEQRRQRRASRFQHSSTEEGGSHGPLTLCCSTMCLIFKEARLLFQPVWAPDQHPKGWWALLRHWRGRSGWGTAGASVLRQNNWRLIHQQGRGLWGKNRDQGQWWLGTLLWS